MSPERRTRARRIVAGLVAIGLIGWWVGPIVWTEVRIHRVERAIARDQLDQAEARLRPLLVERPESTRTRLLLVQIARRQGRITEAEEVLQRLVETGLTVLDGQREHALILAAQDRPEAEKWLKQILQDHPDDDEVRQALARLSKLAPPPVP